MLHNKKHNSDTNDKQNLLSLIKRIKAGDKQLRNELIKDYRPFILKSISNITGRYIELENSDEFSIGLSAFDEAIESFNEDKGNFFSFSTLVINRRITDFIRQEEKNFHTYPFTYFEEDEEGGYKEFSVISTKNEYDEFEFSDELSDYEKKLSEFSITLEDLLECSPKHQDSKKLAINIAKTIANNRPLFNKMEKSHNIPKAELLRLINVNKKTIERHRKFIIAAALAIGNGFHNLRDFIDVSENEGEVNG